MVQVFEVHIGKHFMEVEEEQGIKYAYHLLLKFLMFKINVLTIFEDLEILFPAIFSKLNQAFGEIVFARILT